MRIFIIIIASACNLAAAIPYLIATVRGQTKPRLVSWFCWAVILTIGALAAYSSGQMPAAVLMAIVALESGVVVVLGFKNGDKRLDRFDMFCLVGVLWGLVLWLVLRSSNLVIAVTVATDLVGSLPTLRHAWRKPHEETLATYVLFTVGNVLTLTVANFHVFVGVAYPVYNFLIDAATVALILASPNRQPEASNPPLAPAPLSAGTPAPPAGAAPKAAGKFFQMPYTGNSPASALALKHTKLPVPVLGAPSWVRATAPFGQPVELTVPVTVPEPTRLTGTVYGEYRIGPANAANGKWLDAMTWDGKVLTAELGPFLGPGTFQINVRAKYELGNWSAVSSALLTISAAANTPTAKKDAPQLA